MLKVTQVGGSMRFNGNYFPSFIVDDIDEAKRLLGSHPWHMRVVCLRSNQSGDFFYRRHPWIQAVCNHLIQYLPIGSYWRLNLYETIDSYFRSETFRGTVEEIKEKGE